jgi:hypothetical protein
LLRYISYTCYQQCSWYIGFVEKHNFYRLDIHCNKSIINNPIPPFIAQLNHVRVRDRMGGVMADPGVEQRALK